MKTSSSVVMIKSQNAKPNGHTAERQEARGAKPRTPTHRVSVLPWAVPPPGAGAPPSPAAASLAVVGLGYVGLPLSLQFARSGEEVVGLDIDERKVEALNGGRSYIQHIPAESIAAMTKAKKFAASTDFSRIREVGAVIICVPTPLNKNREPDTSYILETGKAIAPFLKAESRKQKAES